jgi:hypothetical protein
MATTKEDQDQRAADYADQFNQPEQAPREMSEEEAFGLTPEAPTAEAAPEGSPAEEAAESPAEEAAEPPAAEAAETPAAEAAEQEPAAAGETAAEAAPSPADIEQRLKSWEGRLKARQAELDAREAAMGSSSANEEQASLPIGEGEGGGDGYGEGGSDDTDPAAVLGEDFGADFVTQITRLIKKVAEECVGGVSYKVDCVIKDLTNDRLQNHFNSIKDAHADFMDVVESPEFASWKAAQQDQENLDAVIDHGSARQIIDMLTRFKESGKTDNQSADDQIDAAEGVRSSAVSLPQEPAPADDFARAWNEA